MNKDVSLRTKYNKLQSLGLPDLHFKVKDYEFTNDKDKYICTQLYHENDKDKERLLVRLPSNDLKKAKEIISLELFEMMQKKTIIIYLHPPEPLLPSIQSLLDSGLRFGITFKKRAFSSIDELEKFRLTLMKVVAKDNSFKESLDIIILKKLKYCLGLEEPPSLCGELIALQNIVEKIFVDVKDPELKLKALITYVNPSLLEYFKGINNKAIYNSERIASVITINLFDRDEKYGGIRPFLEALPGIPPLNSTEEDSIEKDKNNVKRMINKYFSDSPSGSSIEESEPQSYRDGFLSIKERRELIAILHNNRFFQDRKSLYSFLLNFLSKTDIINILFPQRVSPGGRTRRF
ncbi:hypothetical protein LC653_44770 [Nostoc sp. CHAB 5784]|uniref:hypothetical protein n=1 Tax=Nostoc mirabile TaxID=2907820 RepID=UPI001E367B4A|nr:hypothetical protein [Nostoc mirabile]MCC5670691.1 hypothetical protein [Nostoc mirabile CHAB5784]